MQARLKGHAAILILTAVLGVGHGLGVCSAVIFQWVTIPKSQVGNRIVGLCTFQAFDSILQAVFRDAIVEALSHQLFRVESENVRDTSGGKHDGQSAGKAIEEQGCSRLSGM